MVLYWFTITPHGATCHSVGLGVIKREHEILGDSLESFHQLVLALNVVLSDMREAELFDFHLHKLLVPLFESSKQIASSTVQLLGDGSNMSITHAVAMIWSKEADDHLDASVLLEATQHVDGVGCTEMVGSCVTPPVDALVSMEESRRMQIVQDSGDVVPILALMLVVLGNTIHIGMNMFAIQRIKHQHKIRELSSATLLHLVRSKVGRQVELVVFEIVASLLKLGTLRFKLDNVSLWKCTKCCE